MAAGTKALGSAPEASRADNNLHWAIAGVTISGMDPESTMIWIDKCRHWIKAGLIITGSG